MPIFSRGEEVVSPPRETRTALDAVRGRDAAGTFDYGETLARLADLRLGVSCVEDLIASKRAMLLAHGLTITDLRALAEYLTRRGFAVPADWGVEP